MEKITEEGQRCRHCGTPVLRRNHGPEWKPRKTQPYYFAWWFQCPKCKALYMVDSAKVLLDSPKVAPRITSGESWSRRNDNVDQQFIERLARED